MRNSKSSVKLTSHLPYFLPFNISSPTLQDNDGVSFSFLFERNVLGSKLRKVGEVGYIVSRGGQRH